jgi:hypothetical protein
VAFGFGLMLRYSTDISTPYSDLTTSEGRRKSDILGKKKLKIKKKGFDSA